MPVSTNLTTVVFML
jgi:GABA(A) receptor-associated protein